MSELLQDILKTKSDIKHICIICTQFPPYPKGSIVLRGGAQVELEDLADEIKKHGYDLTIITQYYVKRNIEDCNYIYRVRTYTPYSFHKNIVVNAIGYLVNESFNLLTFVKIYRILKKRKPDVILGGALQLSIAQLIAPKILQIPVLIRYDWICPTYPKDHSCSLTDRICECGNCLEKFNHIKLSGILRLFFGLFSAFVYLLKVRLWNHCCEKIYPVNDFYAKLFIDWGILEGKIKIIRPMVNISSEGFVVSEKFRDLRGKSRIIFAYIGRLNEEKGVRILLNSFKIALNQCRDIILIIAGDGPLREYVEEFASENPQIKYLGWLDRKEIGNIYAISEIIVIPSTVPEGHPLVAEEAMNFGKVILGFNTGGLKEIMKNYPNSVAIEEISENALATQIINIYKKKNRELY